MKPSATITSRDNANLKQVRRIRDGKVRDLIFIEGTRLAEEALRSDIQLTEGFLSDSFAARPQNAELIAELNRRRLSLSIVSDRIFATITDTESSQGLVLIARRPSKNNGGPVRRASPLPITVYLSGINNPSNLGAILRTAEAAGITGIAISKGSADPFSPKALRASMGSAFRVGIYTDAELSFMVLHARSEGSVLTATEPRATKNYTEIDWKKPRLLIFGSEAHGLSKAELAEVDERIAIPMSNEVESLNLAVSCGIVLFEARRQALS